MDRHVEPGQPHGANDGDAEGVLLFLERLVQLHPLHAAKLRLVPQGLRKLDPFLDQAAVRCDVQLPLAELIHLPLLLANDDRHTSLFHPVDSTLVQNLLLIIGQAHQLFLQFDDLLVPVLSDESVHPHAGHLVYAHEHRLAGLPGIGVMLDKVSGDLVEPLPGGDDVIGSLEFLL